MLTLLSLVFACSGTPADDTGEPADTDTDTDADTDTDTDADTDPASACVSGSVLGYDGSVPSGMEVQVCDYACIRASTDDNGGFSVCGLKAGDYKVDALGELLDGSYGHVRANVVLDAAETEALTDELFLPQVYGPEVISSGTYTFGNVSWTVDSDSIEVPFGYEAETMWVGSVAQADIPSYYGLAAEAAVAFVPFDTTVSAGFDLSVTGTWSASSYQVYTLIDHGVVDGPIGTATVSGDTLTATGLQPGTLNWLFFVPG